jgi:branched-chain amino acid transport system substrate-binding protein
MKKYLVIPLFIVLVGALIFGGCAQPSAPTPGPTPAPTPTPSPEIPKEIVVGDTAAFQGPLAVWGQEVTFGAKYAFDDINKQGGVYVKEYDAKLPIRWVVLDSQSDPTKVAALTEDLILREKVNFIGPHMRIPPLGQPVAMVAEKYKIPSVLGIGVQETWEAMKAGASTPWAHCWTFGFRIGTPFKEGDYRANNPGYLFAPTFLGTVEKYGAETNKKVAVAALGDQDGRVWYQAFTEAAGGMGFDCYKADQEFGIFQEGTTDFSPLIQEWKAAGCEMMWGNMIANQFGTLWKQCKVLGFNPKVVISTRAAMHFFDIQSWGADLPNGVCTELFWDPEITDGVGIGDTTPRSLVDRWYKETGKPLNWGIAWDYMGAQILINAIERAGTLDGEAVNKALSETDMPSIWGRVKMDKETQRHDHVVQIGQWQKTDKPYVWECPVIFSFNENVPAYGKMIFPVP